MRFAIIAAAVAVAFTAVPAAADTTITGSGFAVPASGTSGNNSSTAISTDTGTVTGLVLTLTNFSHSYAGDLIFTLSHGSQNFVFANFNANRANAGLSNDFNGTYIINDTAATLFTAAPAPSGVITPGTFRSAPSFASAFGGASALGDWTLSINDVQAQDVGQLGSWSLAITTAQAAVPEPATWALMITGFGAVGASMRRRKASTLATA